MTRARELADLLTGGQTITTDDNTTQLTLTSTDADANVGPILDLVRDSGSPADSDNTGSIVFKADDDGGNSTDFAKIETSIIDASDTTEDGRFLIRTMTAGTATSRLDFTNAETVFNDSSIDVDFRVESDGDANMFFVDAGNNRIGVGTNSPSVPFEVKEENAGFQTILDNDNGSAKGLKVRIKANDSGDFPIFQAVSASTGSDVEVFTILDDGKVGIGTTSPGAELDIESTGPTIHMNDSDGVLGGAITNRILMQASGSTHGVVGFGTTGGNMAVTNANGTLFLQADTNDAHSDSQILFTVDNSTKARVISDGSLLVGRSSSGLTGTGCSFTANSNSFMGADTSAPLVMNRNNNDGTMLQFRQADNVEGSISVSGSTVSYNGGHLARFSQTTDGNRIDGLLKGTVMTNLDQMAVWSHDATEAVDAVIDADGNVITEAVEAKDAYTEDNEQLNCMAVSSVEGDVNVAGVFVNWDDDDEEFTADMNVAMTGDMVIRIAQGTTVARGDLLMSAGDGTAKPQDDDIVRSKTIAKVISTTKAHTYDDGSYLVPCVLMAC